jgi:hypothetical protein
VKMERGGAYENGRYGSQADEPTAGGVLEKHVQILVRNRSSRIGPAKSPDSERDEVNTRHVWTANLGRSYAGESLRRDEMDTRWPRLAGFFCGTNRSSNRCSSAAAIRCNIVREWPS